MFQSKAEEAIQSASLARSLSREDSSVERLLAIEDWLAKIIRIGLDCCPSEPQIVQDLRDELKKTSRLRHRLVQTEPEWTDVSG